jgi:phosphatidylserine synthase 2
MSSVTRKDEDPDLSFTSPAEDSDALLSLGAEEEPEPSPGVNGVPVRCEYTGV